MISNPFYDLSKNICTYISTLPYNKNFNSAIEGIVRTFPGAAHIKNTPTLSYAMINQDVLDNYGYSSANEIIGKSIFDISKKMKKSWPKNYGNIITEYETSVLINKAAIISLEEAPYINAKEQLTICSLSKIPLLNDKKEPIGLLTLALNTARYKDKDFLRKVYGKIYKNKTEALENFLIHIGLRKYVSQYNEWGAGITNRELDCLILLARGKSYKETAAKLELSPRTVEAYVNQVKDKFSYANTTIMLEEFFNYYYEPH